MNKPNGKIKKALICAFLNTLPILAGFLFLGITYGMYMSVKGFSCIYPMIMSAVIFAGSAEFVAADMLLGAFNPLSAFFVTVMINARHIFYGLSMLERFKGVGAKKAYMIFGMCDETFSVNVSAAVSPDVDRGWFMFFVTLLNQFYWFAGATLGGVFGTLIPFELKGLDFVLTAMFVVMFIDRLREDSSPLPALTGLGAAFVCLLIFGKNSFLLPSMALILAVLALVRRPVEKSFIGGGECA